MFYTIVKYVVKFISKILFRVEVTGKENIPLKGACILCFNHKSVLDPPVTGVFMPRKVVYMGKEELFRVPVLGFIIRALGVFPIKRGAGDIAAIKMALKVLKEGKVLAMFPEGTRVKEGQVSQAKAGVALIATKAEVPIIPIAVIGEYRVFHKLHMRIGSPLFLDDYYKKKLPMEKLQEISDDIMVKIQALMEVN